MHIAFNTTGNNVICSFKNHLKVFFYHMLPHFRKYIFISVTSSLRPSGKSGFLMKL